MHDQSVDVDIESALPANQAGMREGKKAEHNQQPPAADGSNRDDSGDHEESSLLPFNPLPFCAADSANGWGNDANDAAGESDEEWGEAVEIEAPLFSNHYQRYQHEDDDDEAEADEDQSDTVHAVGHDDSAEHEEKESAVGEGAANVKDDADDGSKELDEEEESWEGEDDAVESEEEHSLPLLGMRRRLHKPTADQARAMEHAAYTAIRAAIPSDALEALHRSMFEAMDAAIAAAAHKDVQPP